VFSANCFKIVARMSAAICGLAVIRPVYVRVPAFAEEEAVAFVSMPPSAGGGDIAPSTCHNRDIARGMG
jgi:hypothetical protein